MANSLVESVPLTIPGPPPPRRKRSMDDAAKKDSLQHYVTFVYCARIAQSFRGMTVTWCKNATEHSLLMSVENTTEANKFTCKIDLESGQAWGKKGLKSFEIEGARVDIFWDFRHAEFRAGPVPYSGYYVALVYKKEMLLLLGDSDNDAFERTKSNLSQEEATLLCKRENLCGKKMFSTNTILHDVKKEHEIVIETTPLSGHDDPEMLITIDGVLVKRVMNLNWKFRGNEIVLVNNMPVQVFWDVHDWLFNEYGSSGRGVFIFKPGLLESGEEKNNELVGETSSLIGFCHFLYAWRTS